MLYVTTRSKFDPVTPVWTTRSDTAIDGGRYVPFRMPITSLSELRDQSFGQAVADVLNAFFRTSFTGWDVEFSIGRNPVKLDDLGQKIQVAELWHNLDGNYRKLEIVLAARICDCSAVDVHLTSWMRIAVRIAMLHGLFGELLRQGLQGKIDIAVFSGDLTLTAALLYGKQMGLPIGKIICGCEENDAAWDLLQMGRMRTTGQSAPEIERLICLVLGIAEAKRYVSCCEKGEAYALLPAAVEQFKNNIFAASVSKQRMLDTIPNVYSVSGYVITPESAAAYNALMDMRVRTGTRNHALLLCDVDPADCVAEIAKAMNVPDNKLKELLH